ncbi:MAG TPA: hypothetical protein VF265_02825 [Nevskiaceae bacterium]
MPGPQIDIDTSRLTSPRQRLSIAALVGIASAPAIFLLWFIINVVLRWVGQGAHVLPIAFPLVVLLVFMAAGCAFPGIAWVLVTRLWKIVAPLAEGSWF